MQDLDLGLFVGRAGEMDALRALERGVLGGRAAVGVVIAEPGIGKSRLLQEVARELELPRVDLHGYEPAREIPLAAAGPLLRELTKVGGVGQRLEALAFGDAATGGRMGSVRLFEAAFRCLAELGPLTVLIDDLQWADRETLALLHYLVAACERASIPLLALCASRPSGESSELAGALAWVLPAERFAELRLGPLEVDAGVELAVRLAPGLGDERARALWRRAGGSPFWLRALVAGDGGAGSPEGLIRSRYQTLEVEAARLFALLVVAAQPLDVRGAAELTGWQEQQVIYYAGVLANRALAVREGSSVGVVHDLVREAAMRELPEIERRRLHCRLAEWFEADGGDELRLLFRALEHRRAAELESGALSLRIARLPQRRLLGRDGLLVLCEMADQSANGDGVELLRAVASLASELGEWPIALERWARLVECLRAPGDQAQAALAAAQAAVRLERPDAVYEFVSRARALAPEDGVVAIEADVLEGRSLRWLENRVEQAQRLTDRAAAAGRALVQRSGSLGALAEMQRRAYLAAVRAQLDAAIRSGDADAVANCAEEIVAGARESVEVLQATFDRIFGLIMFEGLPRLAEPRARRALEEARRLVLPVIEVEATHWLGWSLHQLGRLEEAETVTRQTVALAERVGPPDRFSIAVLRAAAHGVAASRGDWRPAVEAVAWRITEEPDPHYRLNVRMAHLPLLARFADPTHDEVEELLAGMAADAEAAGCERCRWQQTLLGAEALARLGQLDAARAALEAWDAANPDPKPGPAARREYIEALITARADPAGAGELFERAAQLAEQAGQLHIGLWIDLDAAVALAAVDRAAGIESLRTAAERSATMGAVSEQQLTERQLRALGARTWRRARTSDTGALSERERQIAELVAQGGSNPEIAQALFLSRKTVERHVSNVLAKLGARNRTDLARLLSADSAHQSSKN
jgi:DNA-binding CsgD family transcriptional regulator